MSAGLERWVCICRKCKQIFISSVRMDNGLCMECERKAIRGDI